MKDCHFPHKRRDKNLEPETVKDAICRRKRETPRRWLAFVILSYTNKAASSEFETSLGEILSQRKTKQEILTVKKEKRKEEGAHISPPGLVARPSPQPDASLLHPGHRLGSVY